MAYRSVWRLPLAGDAALARARGVGALEARAGAVEVEVEAAGGVGLAVGVEVGVEVSVAEVEAEAAAAVAVGAEVAEVAAEEEAAEAAVAAEAAGAAEAVGVAVELVAGLRRGVAPVRGGGFGPCTYVLRTGDRAGEQCGGAHPTQRYFGRLTDAWRHQFPEATEFPRWGELSRAGVAIYDLEFDAILSAMYAVTISDEGDCYRCFPPDPGIETAALGTGAGAALGTTSASASLTFTLDSGASRSFFRDHTTLTPLSRPVAVSLADPSGGPVLSHFSTLLPCPAAPSGTLSGLYLPSFSTNLGRQRAASHSSQFPPTEAPLQTLHMDVWGPARVRGQGHERYFLLVVDDYSRYTAVFPLRRKDDVTEVLIDWIRAARLQLRQSFGSDFPVLRLHSDRGGEFSSGLLRAYFRARGIRQTFTLPDSPQQNGIAQRRIGMVMDVPRTSMMHADAPHFLWPFAVRYAAHQINLHPRVSRPETSPALLWTGKVGDASAFQVWGSRAFVCDLSADKLSPRAAPCVFLGFPPDAPGWQFYHPTSRRVLSSQDVTFDESTPSPGAEPGGAATGGAEPGGAEPGGATTGGAQPGGAEPGGTATGGAEPGGATPGGAEPGGAEPEGAEPGGATPRGPPGASSRQEPLSPPELREWFARLWRRAAGAGGSSAAEGAGAAGPGVLVLGVLELLGLRVRLDLVLLRALVLSLLLVVQLGVLLVLLEVLELLEVLLERVLLLEVLVLSLLCLASPRGLDRTSFHSCSRFLVFYLLQLQPASPLPAPSPYTGPIGGLVERREPASRPASRVRAARTSGRGSRQRPPPVPGTHQMSLRPSTAPLRAPLPSPPASPLPNLADLESDSLRAASHTVTRLLATVVTDPSFESTAASVDFAARCRLDYAASLVAESESGDLDALDIPTPRSYAEAIEGPYSSQWQAAMDAEMASWKSTGTYVNAVPPPGANIVSGMWIFMVKRPPGSPPVFKARYVACGFSQRQGVDYFHTFSPTPKMTTLRILLHVAAHCDYELHFLDFSTTFLQGSLHEEIWLRRPLGFTGSFPSGTQWSLRRPVYGLRQAPREWHDTLRTTLPALGFAPSTADPSLFLRTDTSLPPFYILVYVDDLVFATADTARLAYVKSELQKRHTCTDLGELRSYLGLQITRDRARRTITLTQSHMVQQVLQRFGFTYSSPQATPLPTRHSLSALPSDESVESSGPYPELVGCLMYLMTCTRPDLAYPLSILARYVAPGRHRPEHMAAAKRVLRYLCSTSGMGLVLGGRSLVVLTGHADASWADDQATQRSSQGYTFSLGSGSVSWQATRSSSVLSSSCEAEIYAGAMAVQELRWLTYLLTNL
ncbi:unnamed protein product [Closterium sp. NIES-65]|nr:unnamed protein product [Closterium sp. NIES-65]